MEQNNVEKIINTLGIKPNQKLGQVFLADERIIRNQVRLANLSKNDIILEIGPGLGVMTKILARHAKKVIAIELDKRLVKYLEKELPNNVELIFGDAIKIEFPKFNKIVSNIPYQISSPLIFKLINYKFNIAILMFQTEFANRLTAKAKGESHTGKSYRYYSRLSVMASYYYDIKFLAHVSRESFIPVPQVDSTLLQLKLKQNQIKASNEEFFSRLVKMVFSHRRKMIKNSLRNQFYMLDRSIKKLPKNKMEEIISKLPYQNLRPEELSLEDFVQLSDTLNNFMKKLK